jgi:AhpD family alkylhydroperoxidase
MAHPYKHMVSLDNAVGEFGSLDPKLREYIKIRASQLNGCAYCLKMHTDDARALGVDDARMHVIAGWREAPKIFGERERVALELTEAVTLMQTSNPPAHAYARAVELFGEEDAEALLWHVIAINAWNRFAVPRHTEPEFDDAQAAVA